MKKELIIDCKDEFTFNFKINKKIRVEEVRANIFNDIIPLDFKKNNDFYTFKLPNSFFDNGYVGRISFSFVYRLYGKTKETKFSGFNKFEIKNNNVKIINNLFIIPNQTRGYNFVLIVSKDLKDLKFITDNRISSFKKEDDLISIEGFFKSFLLPITKIDLSLEGRKLFSKFFFPITYEINGKYNSRYDLASKFKIDNSFPEDIYDAFIQFYIDCIEKPFKIRFGKVSNGLENIDDIVIELDNETIFISPYITISQVNISLQLEKINNNILKSINTEKKDNQLIVLVGEKPHKAQDSGRAFFKYLRKNHNEIDSYYVIDYNSPEYKYVKNLGNVIDFRSKEHFEVILKADYLFSTHYTRYLYPIINKEFLSKINSKNIFLRHGVSGVKNLSSYISSSSHHFDMDMVCVSSDKEKAIALKDLGFYPEEVKVTGLARFDELFDKNSGISEIKRQLLIIPTWREWLLNKDRFLESEYFERFKDLMSNKILLNICSENNINVIFCLHPNMQPFNSFFQEIIDKNEDSDLIKIIFQGDADVPGLIKESLVMLTDYSSVAFDFAFLDKPVIYYQFDQERFLGKSGSYLDLENELPGFIVFDEDAIADTFKDIIKNDFKITDENKKRAKKFLKYKDTNNSERILNEALNFSFKPPKKRINGVNIKNKTENFYKRNITYGKKIIKKIVFR